MNQFSVHKSKNTWVDFDSSGYDGSKGSDGRDGSNGLFDG